LKILLIPDGHVNADQDLSRFDALGNLILDRKPDVIVQLGDFLSLSSLSHWDMSKRLKMEGRRYRADIEAGQEALTKIFKPTLDYQRKWTGYWKLGSSKMYRPDVKWLLGNHEQWLTNYVMQNPELEGHMDVVADLRVAELLPECTLQVVKYKEYVEVSDIMFTHAPIAGNGQAVSGKYALARASDLTSKSIVFGHCHRWEALNIHRHGSGQLIQLLTAGCFFDAPDEYADGCTQNYWKGVTMLDVWGTGRFDTEQISLERMYRSYL